MRFAAVLLIGMSGMCPAQELTDCQPIGWREGDPVVPDLGAPCLEDERYREEIEQRALNSDGAAAMLLATYYLEDRGKFEEGLAWLRVAAKTGNSGYRMSLASWLAERGTPNDIAEARRAADAAASKGNAMAALFAGDLWLRDRGDLVEAQRAYLVAVELGNADALLRMSALQRIGNPSNLKEIESAAWLQAYILVGAPNDYMRLKVQRELDAASSNLGAASRCDVTEMAKKFALQFSSNEN